MVRFALSLPAVMLVGCAFVPETIEGDLEKVAGTGVAAFEGDGDYANDSPLRAPVEIVFSSEGRPWILDWDNQRVREIDASGRLRTVIGTGAVENGPINVKPTEFALNHATHMQFAPDDTLLLAGGFEPRLFEVEPAMVRVRAGAAAPGYDGDGGPAELASFGLPSGVAIAADGSIFVADVETHTIRRIDPSGMITRFAGTRIAGNAGDGGPAIDAQLSGPTRLALDPNTGDLYVVDQLNHAIRKIDVNGIITTVAGRGTAGFSGDGGPATSAQLDSPMDIELLDDGSFLIADNGNDRIRRVDAAGVIRTVVGEASLIDDAAEAPVYRHELSHPWGIAIDPNGRLWVASSAHHRVYRTRAAFLEGVKRR